MRTAVGNPVCENGFEWHQVRSALLFRTTKEAVECLRCLPERYKTDGTSSFASMTVLSYADPAGGRENSMSFCQASQVLSRTIAGHSRVGLGPAPSGDLLPASWKLEYQIERLHHKINTARLRELHAKNQQRHLRVSLQRRNTFPGSCRRSAGGAICRKPGTGRVYAGSQLLRTQGMQSEVLSIIFKAIAKEPLKASYIKKDRCDVGREQSPSAVNLAYR